VDQRSEERATRVIVRLLSLRAIESVGGVLSPGQLRWACEPVLADHVVPGQAAAVVAPPRPARAWSCSSRAAPVIGTTAAAAAAGSAPLSAVDCKGMRLY
jgi:hypothetical protein